MEAFDGTIKIFKWQAVLKQSGYAQTVFIVMSVDRILYRHLTLRRVSCSDERSVQGAITVSFLHIE